VKKEGSRFIVSILFFTGTIRISTFLFWDKRKVSFPRCPQAYFLPPKNIRNCADATKGLKVIHLTIIFLIEECVPLSYKFKFL